MLKVAIIIGSTRQGRFGPVVADWFVTRARTHGGLELDVIDLADFDLPVTLPPGLPPTPMMADLSQRLHAADAFVLVTPEYNRSFPASVKNVIDWHYTEWRAKPVGLISYGGISGGQHAAQALRGVFAELHAVTLRDTISFINPWHTFDAEGGHRDPEAPEQAARTLLGQLVWWGRALKNARATYPYGS